MPLYLIPHILNSCYEVDPAMKQKNLILECWGAKFQNTPRPNSFRMLYGVKQLPCQWHLWSGSQSPSSLHGRASASDVPRITCASRTLPVATPRVSGDFIPTLPSSDWIKSRILPRRLLFISVFLLSAGALVRRGCVPNSRELGIPSPGRIASLREWSPPLEMLENVFNFGRRMLFGQYLYQSGFKVVRSKILSLFYFCPCRG